MPQQRAITVSEPSCGTGLLQEMGEARDQARAALTASQALLGPATPRQEGWNPSQHAPGGPNLNPNWTVATIRTLAVHAHNVYGGGNAGSAREHYKEDHYANMRNSARGERNTPRGAQGPQPTMGTPRNVPNDKAMGASATKKKKKPRTITEEDELPELPMPQVQAMFQERMKSLMMQDRTRLRKIFQKYDERKFGSLTVEQFQRALADFGVGMERQEAHDFMRKYSSMKSEISFDDFFQRLLGMPKDFFTMDFGREAAQKSRMLEGTTGVKPRRLPAGTTPDMLMHKFVNKLRGKLYDVGAAMGHVMRKKRNKEEFTMDDLLDIFTFEKIQVTKRELKELMDHFDLNGNGKVNYYEFVYELLDLQMPKELRDSIPAPAHKGHRTPLSLRGQELLNKLRVLLISAAARTSRIEGLFQQFDKDGSGSVTYDEIKQMIGEFKLELQSSDGDAASIVLAHFDDSKNGMISYDEFVANTIGVSGIYHHQKGHEGPPNTARVREAVSLGLKELMYNNPKAVKKAFEAFDADNQGQISFLEFRDGMSKIGVPINKKQLRRMFDDFDVAGNGILSVEEFKRAILGSAEDIIKNTPRGGVHRPGHGPSQGNKLQGISEALEGGYIHEDQQSSFPPRPASQMQMHSARGTRSQRGISRSQSAMEMAPPGMPDFRQDIRPSTGQPRIGLGTEAALRRHQDEMQAMASRKAQREIQEQLSQRASQRGVMPPRPATGHVEAMRQHSSRGQARARASHRARMAAAGEKSRRHTPNPLMRGDAKPLGPPMNPTELEQQQYLMATTMTPLEAELRANPYLSSPLASPERFFGRSMSVTQAREMTSKRQSGAEQARAIAFDQREDAHEKLSMEVYDPGINVRGGSPATQTLVGEMRSREMGRLSDIVEKKAAGFQPKPQRSKAPSRPMTQSAFGFDGPDAMRSARTPSFVPKLQIQEQQ